MNKVCYFFETYICNTIQSSCTELCIKCITTYMQTQHNKTNKNVMNVCNEGFLEMSEEQERQTQIYTYMDIESIFIVAKNTKYMLLSSPSYFVSKNRPHYGVCSSNGRYLCSTQHALLILGFFLSANQSKCRPIAPNINIIPNTNETCQLRLDVTRWRCQRYW